eukprot:Em0006g663a
MDEQGEDEERTSRGTLAPQGSVEVPLAVGPVCEGNQVETERKKTLSVGVCAMDVKVSTAAMQSILKRMQFQDYIQIVSFSDYIILNKPIEEWPLCDCLIAFYSKGFPLDKAIAYVNLRHPFVINDLEMQYNLMDST